MDTIFKLKNDHSKNIDNNTKKIKLAMINSEINAIQINHNFFKTII